MKKGQISGLALAAAFVLAAAPSLAEDVRAVRGDAETTVAASDVEGAPTDASGHRLPDARGARQGRRAPVSREEALPEHDLPRRPHHEDRDGQGASSGGRAGPGPTRRSPASRASTRDSTRATTRSRPTSTRDRTGRSGRRCRSCRPWSTTRRRPAAGRPRRSSPRRASGSRARTTGRPTTPSTRTSPAATRATAPGTAPARAAGRPSASRSSGSSTATRAATRRTRRPAMRRVSRPSRTSPRTSSPRRGPDPGSPGGWYDSSGAENGDKCAWTFNVPSVPFTNGTSWKLQGEWSNAAYTGGTGYPNSSGQRGCLDGH